MKTQIGFSLVLVAALAAPSFAQDNPPPPPEAAVAASAEPASSDRGAFVIGAKIGGLFAEPFTNCNAGMGGSCTGLGASFLADVEVGYVLPYLNRSFGILLDVGYTQPTASGDQTDPRIDVAKNAYHWDLTQRELLLGLTVLYRMTFIRDGRIAPYIGIGPRLWLLQTSVNGTAGASTISESTEQSTKVGLSVPIGVDFALGPGRFFGEFQVLWAPIDHRTTGDASVGALTIEAGYRFFL
jgi:opacity protein-like surface antigen